MQEYMGVIREVRLKPGNKKTEAVEWGREMGKGRKAETNLWCFLHLVSSSQPNTMHWGMYIRELSSHAG